MGGNPLARHLETGETFAPGIAHLATGVSEMHRLTGKGVRIGIIDTGVDYRHPALGGDNPATRRVKFGHNFVDNEIINGKLQPPEDPMDCAGHGTMVAGIIGAVTNTYTGVAPDAILGAYKVFGCKPGPTVIKLIVDAIDTAYRHGMDIVNMSFGLEPKEAELLVQAMQEYSRLDMIFIAAVPNYKKGDITGWNADLPGILYYDEYQEEPTYKLACGSKRPYSGMFSGIVAKSAGSRRLCDVPDNARGNIVIVPITFTIPVDLNYAEHWLYSGYIVIDTEAPVNGRPPSDHAVYVPYLGLNGNIQTIHKFFEIRSHSFQR
ncbi:peptidase S8/S53 domain-containing protein [Syncephalis plumigaleata]|nr:peptidase S8/S53 domain-containing protein [Syncephalis plumigaleata]